MSDLAKRELTGTFGGTGTSNSIELRNVFNFSLWGTFDATVTLQRSFDNGATWLPVSRDELGTAASYTAAVSLTGFEPEKGVLYRLNCGTYVSGTVNYRLSAGV